MTYYGVDPSRLGLDATGSAGNEDLFLKVFSGEVLTTFEENNVMMPLHRVRTITSGKTAQFPVTGIATANYHTPGENIADAGNSYLSAIKHAEKLISIDDVLLASTFIANIDEQAQYGRGQPEYKITMLELSRTVLRRLFASVIQRSTLLQEFPLRI